MAPKGLAILREPTLYGRPVEGHPHLTVRGTAILLHVAARIADKRRERRVILGRTAAGDANQDDLHGGLEGLGLRRLGAVGQGRSRLIELGASQRKTGMGDAQGSHTQAQNRCRTQISQTKDAEILWHGVIAEASSSLM